MIARLLISVAFLIAPLWGCIGSTLEVGSEHQYKTVSQAIEAASPFDTIKVYSGAYTEHGMSISKPLTILGIEKPVIDANNEQAHIFIVASDSVIIQGLVLKNVGVSYLSEFSAIKVRRAEGGVISNNEILSCYFGIYLEYGVNYQVMNNQILGTADDEASAGNAIHIWKGDNIEVAHNTLTGHRDGIYFEFVDNSRIHHNRSYKNLRYGLHFMFSNQDQYFQNEFSENGAGVAVMFSKNIRMHENLFSKNWGGASYGLLLKEISDGEITNNRFIRNTIGIMAEGANRLEIGSNQFTLNGTALDIKGNCLDNEIIRNNFLANTFEVVTNSQRNNNLYESNYWSSYKGYDLDRDGVGDVPYRPVNLFAKITNEIPSATIMMHSFFVNLLEFSERIFPDIIPEELVDKAPKMEPYEL